MKKQILNIGKALTKVEQRNIFGGNVIIDECLDWIACSTDADCGSHKNCPKCRDTMGNGNKEDFACGS